MSGRPRIVVVDDNEQDRFLVRRALAIEFTDPDVVEVADQRQLDAVLVPGIDVVVTDYRLRWSDGLQVLGAVHALDADIPVVMFTNTGSEEVAASGLRHGLADYIIKAAHQYARVAHAVRHALQRAAAKRREAEVLAREYEARQAAEEANRTKDEFLATVSHELRTPLNAITGWVHMLRGRLDDRDLARRGLDVMDRNAGLLVRLVEDLMDASLITAGKLTLRRTSVDAPRAVHQAVDSVRAAAAAKQIDVVISAPAAAPAVLADADRLQQILWNLLWNAVKFTPDGGRVAVSLVARDSTVAIEISDSGVGIRPEFLPRVFDRFSQQDSGPRRSYRGLGLGLSLVRQLVEAHGGAIAARSDGEGRGSTFVVELPAAPAARDDSAVTVGTVAISRLQTE